MKKYLIIVLIISIIFTIPTIISAGTKKDKKTDITIEIVRETENSSDNLVQMAILLDTSNSMDGLIAQAKSQLWKIVNELSYCKKRGKSPNLEVALYEYGNDNIPYEEGYLRMVVPFTNDLDKISDELFSLTTRGGSEYCGQVIQSAERDLKWSKDDKTLKVIYIAGNEPFTQGTVEYSDSIKEAMKKDIIVNTIFCGPYETGVNTSWRDGATMSDGKYMNIDHNRKIYDIKAPQDKRILELNIELNNTYIAFGIGGKAKQKLQEAQDSNASSMSNDSIIQRSVAKSSKMYTNSSWDLVDAMKEKSVELYDIDDEELPEEMKDMSEKEKEEYVNEMTEKRAKIQKEINKLNAERREYVNEEMKKQSADNSLDTAIIDSIRVQAKKKGFEFE
jgi:Mg-chelatase subunit ChlD